MAARRARGPARPQGGDGGRGPHPPGWHRRRRGSSPVLRWWRQARATAPPSGPWRRPTGGCRCGGTTPTTWWPCPGAWSPTRSWPRSWPTGRFPPGAEVTVRAGARTGERMVVVDGVADHSDSRRRRRRRRGARRRTGGLGRGARGGAASLAARGGGRCAPPGLGPIVLPVGPRRGRGAGGGGRGGAPETSRAGRELADLYGGVGLFAATVGRAATVELVEASASAAADARVNLQAQHGPGGAQRRGPLASAPHRPGRRRPAPGGARPPGVRAVRGTRAPRLVLVSCDAGALGRDAAPAGGGGLPPRGVDGGGRLPAHPPRRGRVALRSRLARCDRSGYRRAVDGDRVAG